MLKLELRAKLSVFLVLVTFSLSINATELFCQKLLGGETIRFDLEGDNPFARNIRDEVIRVAIDKEKDPFLFNWIETAKNTIVGGEPINRLIQLNKYSYDSFRVERLENPWLKNPVKRLRYHLMTGQPILPGPIDIAHGNYKLGSLLATECGVCRHSSVALVVLLWSFGFENVFYVSGNVEVEDGGRATQRGRHTWVEVGGLPGDDRYFILDPAHNASMVVELVEQNGRIKRVKMQGGLKATYTPSSNDVESMQYRLIY